MPLTASAASVAFTAVILGLAIGLGDKKPGDV
jgi:hypothetical protein